MNTQIKSILEALIKKYFAAGKPDKLKTEGIEEIKLVLKRYKIPLSQARAELSPLIKEIQDQLGKKFLAEHLKPAEELLRKELSAIVKQGKFAVTERQEKIEKIIVKTLQEEDSKNIDKALEKNLRKIKLEQRHIDTEINTTKLALNNLNRAATFESGEVKKLRYVGPSGTVRPFCAEHINKVYTLAEVEKMENDFGQPALIWCGGWNCRHRFVPVNE